LAIAVATDFKGSAEFVVSVVIAGSSIISRLELILFERPLCLLSDQAHDSDRSDHYNLVMITYGIWVEISTLFLSVQLVLQQSQPGAGSKIACRLRIRFPTSVSPQNRVKLV